MADIFKGKDPLPESMTASQWRIILMAMGASLTEIAQVFMRMGLEQQ
jgi:hypothetical protein